LSLAADLIIHPRWLIPVDPANRVLDHYSLVVRAGIILDILPQDEARRRYHAPEVFELPGRALIPGMVNLHAHAAMSLMRGLADDLPLARWLEDVIWPTERKHMSPGFVRDGALLAAREMLRGGITTCNDMYFFPAASAEAFSTAGMRAIVGLLVIGFPSAWANDLDDYLRRGLVVRDQWQGHPRIGFALAPHAPYSVADAGLERVAILAAEMNLPIHIHVHETIGEIDDALASSGMRPLARLERLGLLGPTLTAVHTVHVNETDLALLAHHGCNVAHCPTSNMKLASGIMPLAAMLDRAINIGLGTDGAASNNRLDLFQEMRHAALLAKVTGNDASAAPARAMLRMATLGGARALGLEHVIGSLEIGKHADLCAVDLNDPLVTPCFDPVSHLVHACGREQVTHVWVGGEIRVNDKHVMLQIDDNELLARASLWQTKLVS
jgi:5-methylthioadenosine/S-adenosylhomocysteine deaminase